MLSIFLGSMNCSSTSHKIVFWLQWTTTYREEKNRAKEQLILHVDKLPLYFLCSFYWYFHKFVWWFYYNEISNCCACQPPRLFQPPPFINFGDFCQLPVKYTMSYTDMHHWYIFFLNLSSLGLIWGNVGSFQLIHRLTHLICFRPVLSSYRIILNIFRVFWVRLGSFRAILDVI